MGSIATTHLPQRRKVAPRRRLDRRRSRWLLEDDVAEEQHRQPDEAQLAEDEAVRERERRRRADRTRRRRRRADPSRHAPAPPSDEQGPEGTPDTVTSAPELSRGRERAIHKARESSDRARGLRSNFRRGPASCKHAREVNSTSPTHRRRGPRRRAQLAFVSRRSRCVRQRARADERALAHPDACALGTDSTRARRLSSSRV